MSAHVDRFWRLIATGISFLLFGLGGLVLAFGFFPLLNMVVRDTARRERIAQYVVHKVWRLYIETMVFLGVLTYECHGIGILKAERGVLVVANHPSLLDIVFIMSFMDRTRCVVKAHVWNNPFMSGVVRAANYIPNLGNPQQLVRDCADALLGGSNIIIFPEGSRTTTGQPRRITRGFAHVAALADAPIRLVTINCDPPTLRRGEPWYSIPRHRPHWTIQVHERIVQDDRHEDLPLPLYARQLCTVVERRLEEILC